MGCGLLSGAELRDPVKTVHLRPRYVRLYTDAGVKLAAANYRYKTLDWDVPLDEMALVCLDCWNWHFSHDTFEQMEKVVGENIVPLLAACRANGVLVIHATGQSGSPASSQLGTAHPREKGRRPRGRTHRLGLQRSSARRPGLMRNTLVLTSHRTLSGPRTPGRSGSFTH